MNELPTREVLIFNAALQLPAKNRAGYLSENCQDDAELHRRVVALLEAHERAAYCSRATPNAAQRASSNPGVRSRASVRHHGQTAREPWRVRGFIFRSRK